MRKYIADKICELYDSDFSHFPQFIITFLYIILGDFRIGGFTKFNFPNIGNYSYSDIFQGFDGDWYVYKTYHSYVFPKLSTYDFLSIQPITGPVSTKFEMKYSPV